MHAKILQYCVSLFYGTRCTMQCAGSRDDSWYSDCVRANFDLQQWGPFWQGPFWPDTVWPGVIYTDRMQPSERRQILVVHSYADARPVSFPVANRQTSSNGDQLEQACRRNTTEDQELHAAGRRLACVQKVGEWTCSTVSRNRLISYLKDCIYCHNYSVHLITPVTRK